MQLSRVSARSAIPAAAAASPPHQPSHVARVKAILLFLLLFAAARVPARCASSALSQKNIVIIQLGTHSSCGIDFQKAASILQT
jgi:hypothetical protein